MLRKMTIENFLNVASKQGNNPFISTRLSSDASHTNLDSRELTAEGWYPSRSLGKLRKNMQTYLYSFYTPLVSNRM